MGDVSLPVTSVARLHVTIGTVLGQVVVFVTHKASLLLGAVLGYVPPLVTFVAEVVLLPALPSKVTIPGGNLRLSWNRYNCPLVTFQTLLAAILDGPGRRAAASRTARGGGAPGGGILATASCKSRFDLW